MTANLERDRQMVELWLDGTSTDEIADRFGCDPQTVKAARKAAGKKEADRRKAPRRLQMHERKPLSSLHSHLGFRVSSHRSLVLKLERPEFAKQARLTTQRLVEIEAGVRQITLSEIQRLALIINKPVAELLTMKDLTC